ncbi:apoptosis regulator BAX-like [Brachionichthys hirsutus]|uniref:apoptosis regulator BAX-like n=1 Tax=Brachionichthys hirsutus TaxID=412623 RepID=UPI003604F7AD
MAAEGSGTSDERIGEELIRRVIRGGDSPPLIPTGMEVSTVHERKIVDQLTKMVLIIGDRVKDDQELKDAIDGVAACPSAVRDRFMEVAKNVFEKEISWENILVLFYVASRLAVKVVQAHFPNLVKDILKMTLDFFRRDLLGWIQAHGGWISSFSELAGASMRGVSSIQSRSYGLALTFIAGLVIGSFVSWRISKGF